MANKHPLRNRRINYRDGWFFVTFQVAHNKSVLGAIAEARCNLTPLGRRLVPLWMAMRQHHEELWTDAFVVMPNHFHAIVQLAPGTSPGATIHSPSRTPGACPQSRDKTHDAPI